MDMAVRRVKRVCSSVPTLEGAGVRLRRAFGNSQTPEFDPFLLLDEFHTVNPDDYMPGFPWHPHRGMETITYIIEGLVEHSDSMGNAGTIGAGEVQWMTAGSGIIHQEMPQETGSGAMWGFQVWANLPAAQKMMAPRYRSLKPSDMPTVALALGAEAKVISGVLEGVQGPVRDIVTDPEFFDVSLPANCAFTHNVKPDYTAIAYVLDGQALFDDGSSGKHNGACKARDVVLYEREGDRVCITSPDAPARFLYLSGRPLGEPIAWQGPIVMNTEEELREAFRELQDGTFVRHEQRS